MLRLSQYAKTPVPPGSFWLAAATAVVLVSGIGLLAGRAWHGPDISRWFWGGAILVLWGVAVIHLVRHGRAAFPWQRVVFTVGYTLYAVGQLWPHPPRMVAWASGVGICIVMAWILSPFFVFGRQPATEGRT